MKYLPAAVAALVIAVTFACSPGSDPTASTDEAAVCDAVQGIVDNVLTGGDDGDEDRNEPALAALGDLLQAVNGTDNEVMANEGSILFETISEPVDAGSLTIEQTVALGRAAAVESSQALDAIVLECEAVGAPIEDLDLVPVDELDQQIVDEYAS